MTKQAMLKRAKDALPDSLESITVEEVLEAAGVPDLLAGLARVDALWAAMANPSTPLAAGEMADEMDALLATLRDTQ